MLVSCWVVAAWLAVATTAHRKQNVGVGTLWSHGFRNGHPVCYVPRGLVYVPVGRPPCVHLRTVSGCLRTGKMWPWSTAPLFWPFYVPIRPQRATRLPALRTATPPFTYTAALEIPARWDLRPNGATSKLMGNLAPSCCRVFGLCSGQVRDAADAWSRYVRVGVGLRSGLGLLVVGLRSGWGRVAVGLRAHWGRLAFGLGSWCVRAGVG